MKNKLNSRIRVSRLKDVMTNGRGKESFGATAMSYAIEVAAAHFGVHAEEVSAKPLDWGNEYEWLAIDEYMSVTMAEVHGQQTELIDPSGIVSGHPDGLVGDEGLIEVKCPYNPMQHINNIIGPSQFDSIYQYQIQGYLWLSGRKWCDCVSFDPRAKNRYKHIHVKRVNREDELIEQMRKRCEAFYTELVLPLVDQIQKA